MSFKKDYGNKWELEKDGFWNFGKMQVGATVVSYRQSQEFVFVIGGITVGPNGEKEVVSTCT